MPQGLAEHQQEARQRMAAGTLPVVAEAREAVLQRRGERAEQPQAEPEEQLEQNADEGADHSAAVDELAQLRVQRLHNSEGGDGEAA